MLRHLCVEHLPDYLRHMTVAVDAESGNVAGASRVYLRWHLVEQWCHDQGANSDVDRAERFGVNRMTVGRWKRGDTGVSLPVANRVSQVTGVSLTDLITDTPPPVPTPPPPQPPRPSGPPGRVVAE
jgi:hypothetical protein